MGNLNIDEDVEIKAPYTGNLYAITDREVRHCEGLPLIKGPDNHHEAAFMELSLFEQFAFTSPVPGVFDHIEQDVHDQAA